MRNVFACLVLSLVPWSVCATAWATEYEQEVKSVPQYLSDCEAGDAETEADCTRVIAVVLGSVANYKQLNPTYPVCVPAGQTAASLQPVIFRWLHDYPVPPDNKNAATAILLALQTLYPCAAQN